MKDHIIICGFGHVGFRTFELLRKMNQQVTVISNVESKDWHQDLKKDDCVFILGDARSETLLMEAGIHTAKAILALTDQDMVNVSIIMDARKLNPTIRIISRIYDTELGKHIAEAFNVHQMFSTSELAAPIFTSNIYTDSALAQFTVNKKTYIVYDNSNAQHRAITEKNAFVLAACTKDNECLVGDQIKKTNTPHDVLMAKDISHSARKARTYTKLFDKVNYLRSPIFANVRRILSIITTVIVIAAIFIHWKMSLPFIDALYFVVTTITTVGYGDYNFMHATTGMKLFGCALMLSGAASLTILFSSITEVLLSRKLVGVFGGRPIPKKNHVIVVGAGHIGYRVISKLIKERIPIVVIENELIGMYDDDIKARVAVIHGDARNHVILATARVRRADSIFVISNDDVENLSVSLAAKKMNPAINTIVQIFDSRLDAKLHGEMSLNRVLSVSNVAAPYIAASVLGKKILLALKWKNHLVYIFETTNEDKSQSIQLSNNINSHIQINAIPLK